MLLGGAVQEFVKATRIIGLSRLMRLRRAQRLAWPNLINGFVMTRVIQTLLNIGFFDQIRNAGRVEPTAFAASNNLDESILRSLCDALYASHILEKDGDAYQLSETGTVLIDTGRGWFDAVAGYEGVYHHLEGLLRKERQYGVDVHRRSGLVAKGTGEIESILYFPLAIDVIKNEGWRHVLDLACGDGTFLRHACQAIPGIKGYGIDVAVDAIADAKQLSREAALSDRLQFFAEDMTTFSETPGTLQNVDVATTFFVLHELLHGGAERVVGFLKAFRRNFPGVPLLIFEVDRPTPEAMRNRRSGMAIPYFLQHDLSNQKPMARREWWPLLKAAGFDRIEERNLAFARSVIFTVQ